MANRAQAEASCRVAARAYPEKTYSVYRVGGQWMFTSEPPGVTQRRYKVKVCDWAMIVKGTLDV